MQSLDAPAVKAVQEYLRRKARNMAPGLLAAEARRHLLAWSLVKKLLVMGTTQDCRELHALLVPAYPNLVGEPPLETVWKTSRKAPGPALAMLMRVLFADDGTFQLAAVRHLKESLNIDLPEILLVLLEMVVGTDAQPPLHVRSIKLTASDMKDYGSLWAAPALELVRLKQYPAAVEAFQRAAQQRRFAPRTNWLAGRAFRLAGQYKHAESFLLLGEKESRMFPKERPRFVDELVALYRTTGNQAQLDVWDRSETAAEPTIRHVISDMVPYLEPLTPALEDYHCPDKSCDCGVVFFRVHGECYGLVEVRLRQQSVASVQVMRDVAHCEHLVHVIQKALASPNEVRFMRQRTAEIKALMPKQMTLSALAHLPPRLLQEWGHPLLSEFDTWLEARVDTVVGPQPVALLRARGFDIEPEGGVLLRLPRPVLDYTRSQAMRAAVTFMRLGYYLRRDLEFDTSRLLAECRTLPLEEADVRRLRALSIYHETVPVSGRLAWRDLERNEREWMGRALVHVLHDRAAHPRVVARLEKLYALLGLEPQQLFTALHAAGTGTLRTDRKSGLDRALIEVRMNESREVDTLLEEIFREEEAAPVGGPTASPPGWRLLLDGLATSDQWSRADAAALAASLNVPLNGAIDTINDLALERCDELALEGDDPIYVNREVLALMQVGL